MDTSYQLGECYDNQDEYLRWAAMDANGIPHPGRTRGAD